MCNSRFYDNDDACGSNPAVRMHTYVYVFTEGKYERHFKEHVIRMFGASHYLTLLKPLSNERLSFFRSLTERLDFVLHTGRRSFPSNVEYRNK